MSTTKDTEFDYQTYTRQNPPDPGQMQRGPEARQQRRDMAKSKITIRIDPDILEQFKQMVPDGQGYQRLINQALREWLMARDMQDVVREELRTMTAQVIAAVKEASHRS
jgi:uncharacterized protein (DUF4415 family)